ncbi:MAG: aldo/keto reductase, partial [Clostridia bacterium]|nr:aldo/keto reductase [Clostridia bacterium]
MTPFKTDKKLGFGLMRLPTLEDKSIDMATLTEMVDLYMASGFNYFDTAYNYHGGESENAIRKALVERYPRESYTLANKLPAWVIRPDKALVQKGVDELADIIRSDVNYNVQRWIGNYSSAG